MSVQKTSVIWSNAIVTMKKMIKNLMLVAVAAMAFVGCTTDMIGLEAFRKSTKITFDASFEEDTRVSMNDNDNDGIYKVAWEAGDEVVFAAYDDSDNLVDIQTATVAEAGANATFDIEFETVLTEGQKIVAYTGREYYNSSYWKEVYSPNISNQTPRANDVEKVYTSAEFVYGGQDMASLRFKHDCAYALMNVAIDGVEKVEEVQININNYEQSIALDGYNVENNAFMFVLNPVEKVNSLVIEARSGEDVYTYVREEMTSNLSFEKGRISKFGIKNWQTVLATPEVKSESGVGYIKFYWEAVEGAQDYTVVVNYNYGEPQIVAGCEYLLENLEPFASYTIQVVANPSDEKYAASKEASANAQALIAKDAAATEGLHYTYTCTTPEVNGNIYKFYSEDGTYMSLSFDRDIKALDAGSYVYTLGNGVNFNTDKGDSAFNDPANQQPGYGVWWFQDDFVLYVDVEESGLYTFTAFCKRYVNGFDVVPIYKGEWRGYLTTKTLATPANIQYTVEGSVVTLTWDEVDNATGYNVSCEWLSINENITENTYTFDTNSYAQTFTFYIKATSSVENLPWVDSAAAHINVTTGEDTRVALPNVSNIVYTIDEEAKTITFTWDEIEGAAYYDVMMFSPQYTERIGLTECTTTFSFVYYADYEFTFAARPAANDKQYLQSGTVTLRVNTGTAPKLATPVITANAVGKKVTVSWEAVANASGYSVKVGDLSKAVGDWVTSAEFDMPAYETEYTVEVFAKTGDSLLYQQSETATTTVTTGAAPAQLTAPASVDANATSDSAVTVTWSDVENEVGYIVTVGDKTVTVAADVLTCEITGLAANTTYDVSVVAMGDDINYTNSAATTTTVTTEEGAASGAGYENWVFSASTSGFANATLTFTDGNHTVTCRFTQLSGTIPVADSGFARAYDFTVNGTSVDAANVSGSISLDYNTYKVTLDLVINGVKYTGTSTNGIA